MSLLHINQPVTHPPPAYSIVLHYLCSHFQFLAKNSLVPRPPSTLKEGGLGTRLGVEVTVDMEAGRRKRT